MDTVFRYSKVFRLHAIIHDAAGAVQLQTCEGPGYCYMIGRDRTIFLSLRKNLSTLHFQFNQLFDQYVFDCN